MDKKIARKNCFANLKEIDKKEKEIKDRKINEEIVKKIADHEKIGIYSPIRNEIIIDEELLKKDNKELLYPVVIGKEMKFYRNKYGFEKSSFGILEPIIGDQEEVIPDILIAPCVGFFNNYRLGYGGGYYDRFLSIHKVAKIGIAYIDCQLDSLEVDDYDIAMDYIIKY